MCVCVCAFQSYNTIQSTYTDVMIKDSLLAQYKRAGVQWIGQILLVNCAAAALYKYMQFAVITHGEEWM